MLNKEYEVEEKDLNTIFAGKTILKIDVLFKNCWKIYFSDRTYSLFNIDDNFGLPKIVALMSQQEKPVAFFNEEIPATVRVGKQSI